MSVRYNFEFPSDQLNIAVGLSGGGDSMALTHMLCQWAATQGSAISIHALTVDHNLRDNSGEEAEYVASLVQNFPNIHHVILKWDHESDIDTAVMERARQARYELMTDYCKARDIETLAIAHHADDQFETFMFRLAKGSGLDGLAGMQETTIKNDVIVYRPLLSLTHSDLLTYCRDNNLQWIEDPSNGNESYARPRLRKALQEEGFSNSRYATTLRRLSEARDALNWLASEAINEVRLGDNRLDWGLLRDYPFAIKVKVLQSMITECGSDMGKPYPPKLERVEEIVATIQPSKSATLYGCVLKLSKDGKILELT